MKLSFVKIIGFSVSKETFTAFDKLRLTELLYPRKAIKNNPLSFAD
jgi:hypothetical protein